LKLEVGSDEEEGKKTKDQCDFIKNYSFSPLHTEDAFDPSVFKK
jgi:hypothetical protein